MITTYSFTGRGVTTWKARFDCDTCKTPSLRIASAPTEDDARALAAVAPLPNGWTSDGVKHTCPAVHGQPREPTRFAKRSDYLRARQQATWDGFASAIVEAEAEESRRAAGGDLPDGGGGRDRTR